MPPGRRHKEPFAGLDRPGQRSSAHGHSSRRRRSHRSDLAVTGLPCALEEGELDEEAGLMPCFGGASAATVDRFDARLLLPRPPAAAARVCCCGRKFWSTWC